MFWLIPLTLSLVAADPDLSFHFWSHDVQKFKWLRLQSTGTSLNIEDEIGVSTVIDNAKALYRQVLLGPGISNSVSRYREMLQLQHQEYVLAPYLSTLKTFRSRRVVSRFRCGCHDLHVDTGNFKPVGPKVDREQRFYLKLLAHTQQRMNTTFVFDCPAYFSVRDKYTAIFWGPACTLSSIFALHDLPSSCMNVCTQVYVVSGNPVSVVRGYIRGRLYLQLSLPQWCHAVPLC